jgi:phosphate transport system substrate-binding protein
MIRTRRRLAVAAGLAAFAAAAPATALASSTTITISGSTAMAPLTTLLAESYIKSHKTVHFKVAQGGTGVGISDVEAGSVNIADVARDPASSDPSTLHFYPIARYFVCVITNPKNRLANLTTSQVQSIFSASKGVAPIRTWSGIPGAGVSGTIDVFSRQTSAGVLTNFQTLLLGGDTVSSAYPQESSDALEQKSVEDDPNGVGFVSNYLALSKSVNAVAFNGVACTKANALSGQYLGVGRFYLVTNGPATGASLAFINWAASAHNPTVKKIVASGWLPVTPG